RRSISKHTISLIQLNNNNRQNQKKKNNKNKQKRKRIREREKWKAYHMFYGHEYIRFIKLRGLKLNLIWHMIVCYSLLWYYENEREQKKKK
ncbi:unnamed protein product, partial [Diamesa serratosioi]